MDRPEPIYVVDRHGASVELRLDEITARNAELCRAPEYGPPLPAVDVPGLTLEVVRGFRPGMTTREIDAAASAAAARRSARHPDYDAFAARVQLSDMHKTSPATIGALAAALGEHSRMSDEFVAIVERAGDRIRVDFGRDYRLRLFGYQTFARSYLARSHRAPGGDTIERPQLLYLRVAVGIFMCDADGRGHLAPDDIFDSRLARAMEFYDALSTHRVSNATPTMLNAGTRTSQLSSCFQLATADDLPSLFDTLKTAALTSKMAGGVSVWLAMRAEHSLIRGTGGESSGIKQYVRLLNDTQIYIDQGGKRPGAFAVYLGVEHADVITFLRQARPKGEESTRSAAAPDLKYALWVSDLFMETLAAELAARAAGVSAGVSAGDWHLFSPDEAPGLHVAYGDEYRRLYAKYVSEKKYRAKIKASELISEAFGTWAQSGVPYVLFKDAINAKSNLRHVAPIASSNLCVAGHTRVLTDRGFVPISELTWLESRVWNGSEWSGVAVFQTAIAAQLFRVSLSNGASIDCTPEHKFYVSQRSERPKYVSSAGEPECDCRAEIEPEIEVRAGELAPGDVLCAAPAWPVVGTPAPSAESRPREFCEGYFSETHPEVANLMLTAPLPSRVEWLSGLFAAAGVACEDSGCLLVSCDIDLLRTARLVVQTLGRDTRIARIGETEYALRLDRADRSALELFGFVPMLRDGSAPPAAEREHPRAITVVSVVALPGTHATYCFTEPLRHRGVFEGVLTGQCCEITIPSWSDHDAPEFAKYHPDNARGGEFGVCNLAAVCLESFVAPDNASFDFRGAADAAALEVRALDRVIDLNCYPSEECRRSNRRHRPVGVGIMGLADVFARMRLAYGSKDACALARGIAASVYYGALGASCEAAAELGPHPSWPGSPAAAGELQPDMWAAAGKLAPDWESEIAATTGGAFDWGALRARCRQGVRNAYVTAYMPTATTSNIVGQNECFEPFTSNLYTRRTLAGEFVVINRHLMRELSDLELWDEPMRRELLLAGGSVQQISRIPDDIRGRYRTAREVGPSATIKTARAMAPFICQSMSMNLYLDRPDLPQILRFLVDGWRAGLKTGMYYCHTAPAAGAPTNSVTAPAARAASKPKKERPPCEAECTSCAL